MQDDSEDWLQQTADMDKIYSGASLNLAATASEDDSGGLFYCRSVGALQPCIVEATGADQETSLFYCLRSGAWHDLVDSSPLHERAWTFQELRLAKRTLHFSRNELFWECQQVCCSEVFPKGLSREMTVTEKLPSASRHDRRECNKQVGNWHELVNGFTYGKLTYRADKLIALQGLVRQYANRNRLRHQDYLAGLWRPHLPHALLWRVQKGTRSSKYRAPSWSWASTDGIVTCPPPSTKAKEASVQILDVQTTPKHKLCPLGAVKDGSMRLRAFLIRGTLQKEKDYWGEGSCLIQGPHSQIEIESSSFDERVVQSSTSPGTEVYCMPIIDTVAGIEGLLLCATQTRKGEFRRVGTFQVAKHNQTAWSRFKENIKGDSELDNYEDRSDHFSGHWFSSNYTYTITIV